MHGVCHDNHGGAYLQPQVPKLLRALAPPKPMNQLLTTWRTLVRHHQRVIYMTSE